MVELLGDRCCGMLPEAVSQVPIELAQRGRKRGRDGRGLPRQRRRRGLDRARQGHRARICAADHRDPDHLSGSEMTGFCGITIDGVKRMHASLDMLASTVIYDPELSVGLPLDVSMASAMNALAHCIDAVYLATVSPIILAAAHEGAARLMDAMPRVARARQISKLAPTCFTAPTSPGQP